MQAYPILFLDDNDLSHNFISAIIEVEKLPVLPHFEVSPFSAISYLQAVSPGFFPQAIVSDINMPRMNGFEFFELFNQEFPELASHTGLFIMSSGIQLEEYTHIMNTPHIDSYVPKPLDKRSFFDIIFPILEDLVPVKKRSA